MNDQNFAEKLKSVLRLLGVDRDAFTRIMNTEAAKHRTTVSGWLAAKSVPTPSNRRTIERVLNIPDLALEQSLEDIELLVGRDKLRIKQYATPDNAWVNKSFVCEYVMFRFTFSNYLTNQIHFIRSTIVMERVGPNIWFTCDEPRYPFAGWVEFSDRNLSFRSTPQDTTNSSGFWQNMLIDKHPSRDRAEPTPKFLGILSGTSYMDGMQICATKVLLLKRTDYEQFCDAHDFDPLFEPDVLARSMPDSFELPSIIGKLNMSHYFQPRDENPFVLKCQQSLPDRDKFGIEQTGSPVA